MRKASFTEEQIIGILKEHDAGAKVEDLCRRHGISGATFYLGLNRPESIMAEPLFEAVLLRVKR